MDTNELKKQTGFNDDQISYLIKKVDVLKRGKAQGKAREYSSFDVKLFEFAAFMTKRGYTKYKVIRTLNLVSEFLAELGKVKA